jgi:hypothetical protein
MDVKGTAIIPIVKFAESKFGATNYEWTKSLSGPSAEIMKTVLSSSWYPLQEAIIEPTVKLCDLVYGGKDEGAFEIGKFSADFGLKGVYKLFVKLGSPSFIISKGSSILGTYYKDSVMDLVEEKKNSSLLRITRFPGIHKVVELRIAGWMQRSLEICGCKDIKVNMPKLLSRGDAYTEYMVTWN